MSKQQTQSPGTRREPADHNQDDNNQKVKQSPDRQLRATNPANRENDKQAQEGGSEESKHGRKQKGNIEDT